MTWSDEAQPGAATHRVLGRRGAGRLEPLGRRVTPGGVPGRLGDVAPGGVGRRAEAGDAGEVLGAGAQAALVPAAVELAVDGHALGEGQRPDPLRPADLVGRQGQGVGAERRHVDWELADGLDRVDVDQPAGGVGNLGGLEDRLDHACLVVGQHQDGEGRPVGLVPAREPALQPLEVGDPAVVHRPDLDGQAARLDGLGHGGVFAGAHDQPLDPAGRHGAADGQGVGLGAAAGEDEAFQLGADDGGDLRPGLFDRRAGAAAAGVDGGRIAADGQGPRRRLRRLGADWRGGVVVEVDGRAHAAT
jgi:hypothetical protein